MIKNVWNLFGLLSKSTQFLDGCKHCQSVIEHLGMKAAHHEYECFYYPDYENDFDRGYRDTLFHFRNLLDAQTYENQLPS